MPIKMTPQQLADRCPDGCEKYVIRREADYVIVRQSPPRPGLGDRVAAALAAVGITKERVSKALGKPCGCAKRQQRLNELGRKFGIG